MAQIRQFFGVPETTDYAEDFGNIVEKMVFFTAKVSQADEADAEKVILPFLASYMFFLADADNNGFVSSEEFKKFAVAKFGLTGDEASEMLTNFDTNHDGQLDYSEWTTLVNTCCASIEE